MKIFAKFFFLIMIQFLVGCTVVSIADSTKPFENTVDIDSEHLNQQLEVYAPAGWNSYEIGESISVEVRAHGNDLISFSPKNVLLFIQEDGDWHEVRNKMTYFDGGFSYVLDPSNDDPFSFGTTGALPVFPDRTGKVNLRVYVFGYILESEQITDEKVGAYVDVTLKP